MLNFVKNLVALNFAMANKVRSITAYDEALALHSAKDFKKALPLMLESAMLGYPAAMCVLGSMYLLGQGVKEDGKEAEKWLVAAMDAGFEGAVSVLGMAYATGKAGIKIDIQKARMMLETSASKGDEQSSRMLQMMDRGEGMFANLKQTSKGKKPRS
jgi:TPR repeat protein